MNVLSLFDGMSCGMIALERAGIEVNKYYASEVDKYAEKVSAANYTDIIRLGDVTKWREWDIDWSSIDLLIGGSPCQGFSFAGKQFAFNDPRSSLFFEYLNILNHIKSVNPGVKFLLENVRMKKEYLDVISDFLGVEPVFINSALVSAQNRQRYYWANWEFEQPQDKGVLLKDIIQTDGFGILKNHGVLKEKSEKANCVDANYHKGIDNHGQRTVICAYNRNDGIGKELGKAYTINASDWRGLNRNQQQNCVVREPYYRKLTPVECERLQTVLDDYTNHVSNTQRYKMLGNGWTVDVISHIFKGLLIKNN